jgi:hypothetical protein
MMRNLATATALLLVAVTAAGAHAADTLVVADPTVERVAALDTTIVWVSGKRGSQILMSHTGSGDAPVSGAPPAFAYPSIDLGHDPSGNLILTYEVCEPTSCAAFHDDLAGHHGAYTRLAGKGCSLASAPAVWGTRIAYGRDCLDRDGIRDPGRSGLYVLQRSRRARRLPLPALARRNLASIEAVDLRGGRVAAVVQLSPATEEISFSETVAGRHRYRGPTAARSTDIQSSLARLTLGPAGALWTLINGFPGPNVISRTTTACTQSEELPVPLSDPPGSLDAASDMAIDGATMYLAVPGTGIVTHDFEPGRRCT